jgi:sugar phosphate isomerase/epimerase
MRPHLLFCHAPFGKDAPGLREYRVTHGYDGVEWNLENWRLMRTRAPRASLFASLAAASPLCSLHAPYADLELGHPDPEQARAAAKLLEPYVDAAAELSAHHLNLHTGSYIPAADEWSRDNTLRGLEGLMAHAARRGVPLTLENLRDGPTSDPGILADLLRNTGIGLNFDLGHAHGSTWVRSGRGSVADVLGSLPAPVLAAHVYWSEIHGAHHAPRAVEDIAEALDALQARSCDFWVLELHSRDALERTRSVVRDYLAQREGAPARGAVARGERA